MRKTKEMILLPNKITIIRLSTRIYPDTEGTGPAKHAYLLSKYASDSFIKIVNITCTPIGGKKIQESQENCFKIDYLPFFAPSISKNSQTKKIMFVLMYFFLVFLKVLKIRFRARNIIIHAHSPAINGIIAFIFYLLFRIPYIFTYHGIELKNSIESFFYRIINSFAKKIIVITRRIKTYFEYFHFPNVENVVVLPNGIEIDSDQPKHVKDKTEFQAVLKRTNIQDLTCDSKITLYIGHMVFKQKVAGMIDFMNAFDSFISEIKQPDKIHYKLLFLGDGPFFYLLRDAFEKIRNKNNIIFGGYRTDVKKLLSIAELTALTSYNEGFPNVILESMIAGVPCIATDVGDVKYAVKDTGFIVKKGDIVGMKQSLQEYFFNKNLQDILKTRSFERAKNFFNWKNLGERYKILYRQVVCNS